MAVIVEIVFGIDTDGAPSMIGCNMGLVSFTKEQNENVIVTRCFLHIEAAMSMTLGGDLREVLDQVVHMVNFVKTRPVKSRLFEQIYTNMESQHRRLLLHTYVRWLSRGKVHIRVHELRRELITFLEAMKQSHSCNLFQCECWITNHFVKTLIYYSLALTEKEELAALSTDRGLMIKYKQWSLEDVSMSINEEHVSISKQHWPFYCNFPPHIYVNWDFQPSPQLSVERE